MSGLARFGRRVETTPPIGDVPARKIDGVDVTQRLQTVQADRDARDALNEFRRRCLDNLNTSAIAGMSGATLMAEMRALVKRIATETRLEVNAAEQESLAVEMHDDIVGLGPLQPLIEDDSISDIMVNGPDRVFVERNGMLTQSQIRFRDETHLVNICQRIASRIGRRVDEASPMVDARLQDGSRVNIVLQPVSLDGAALSIRKFRKKAVDLEALVEYGTLTEEIAKILEIIAHCRLNLIISGGTGSGKTTLLNAMSRHIDPTERVVTVEDAAELQLQQPHVVRLETRPQSREAANSEVTARDLVKNALRMRPDRIIIGEVRGAEAFDMLQAMNTGHDGSMSTVHANNARDAIARVENMVQMSNTGLSLEAVRGQIVSAINIIIQIQRHRDGSRKMVQLVELAGREGDRPLLNEIASYQVDGENINGRIVGHWEVQPVRSSFHDRLVYYQLDRIWKETLEAAARR